MDLKIIEGADSLPETDFLEERVTIDEQIMKELHDYDR